MRRLTSVMVVVSDISSSQVHQSHGSMYQQMTVAFRNLHAHEDFQSVLLVLAWWPVALQVLELIFCYRFGDIGLRNCRQMFVKDVMHVENTNNALQKLKRRVPPHNPQLTFSLADQRRFLVDDDLVRKLHLPSPGASKDWLSGNARELLSLLLAHNLDLPRGYRVGGHGDETKVPRGLHETHHCRQGICMRDDEDVHQLGGSGLHNVLHFKAEP
mmetsp:Transcript_63993/g.169415  ORF Transcript_63993/g.169415 Transcript_63993/m.169415 type:complete len:214 (-) Transcript_63993:711-1352(-)